MAVHVLDNYYLSITFLITVAYQLFFFAIAFTYKFDKLTDFAGGTNFVVLAIITLALSDNRDHARNVVVSLFIMVWGLRLSGFLLFRILKTGKDDRFDDKRDSFFKFLGFWIFQMLWVWTVSLPVTILNSPEVAESNYRETPFGTGQDITGVVLYVVGLIMETVSDAQKYRFRSEHGNDGTICDKGLFAWSRHPNYFGEMIIHFGIWVISISPALRGDVNRGARNALIASVVGPLFLTFLLMFVSGLPLQERPGAKKRYEKGSRSSWEAYSRYLNRTSILIPFPPQLYTRTPIWLKRTLFLEFPIYVFDPVKHSDQSKLQSDAGQSRVSQHGGRPSDEEALQR